MITLIRRWGAASTGARTVALIAVAYLLTLSMVERDGLWQSDNENKLLQVQAILHSGGHDFSLPWPGKALDPKFDYNPIPFPFSHVEDGKLYSVFSPVFALVSAVPYALLGQLGLYVLPLVASLVMLVGVGRLAHRISGAGPVGASSSAARHVAMVLAGLGSPIWVYSVTFWEHTIAVCLCVWSLCFLVQHMDRGGRASLASAAVLAALGVYFRDELYIFCLLICAMAAYFGTGQRLRTGAEATCMTVLALVPLWLFQWHAIGHPFGFHLGAHLLTVDGVLDHLVTRPQLLFNMLVSSTPYPLISFLLIVPFAATLVWRPTGVEDRRVLRIALAALVSAGISLSGYLYFDSPIWYMLHAANSLFAVAPFIVLGLLRWQRDDSGEARVRNCVWLAMVGFALLYVLAAPPYGSRGIHWGNRYLLLMYVLAAALAAGPIVEAFAAGSRRRGGLHAIIVGLIGLSFGAQLYSLHVLDNKKELSLRFNEAVGQRPETVIVSTVRWAPQMLFASFYDKSVFYASSPASLARLTLALRAAGERQFLLVTSEVDARPQSVPLRDEELGFFSLALSAGRL